MTITNNRPSRGTEEADQGFSMIEIMVAFLVIGLVLAAAMPAFNKHRLTLIKRQACAQMVRDLRAARQMAVTQHTRVVVAFGNGEATTDVTSYTVHADRNADNAIQTGEYVMKKTLPRDSRLSRVTLQPTDSLTFEISGILRAGTKGGQLIVAGRHGPNDTLTVSVGGMTYEP